MKKILVLLLIPIIFTTLNYRVDDDLIRIRVIANSNSEYDQNIKMNISNKLKDNLYELLKDEKNVNNARKIIKDNIPKLEELIDENLDDYGYEINYGMNYFPEKKYKGKTYKKGNYESLLVKIGEAKGDNWWCILFPPICLIEVEESKEVEYSFFLKDLLDTFFK